MNDLVPIYNANQVLQRGPRVYFEHQRGGVMQFIGQRWHVEAFGTYVQSSVDQRSP